MRSMSVVPERGMPTMKIGRGPFCAGACWASHSGVVMWMRRSITSWSVAGS
jgi:hypothetical protein